MVAAVIAAHEELGDSRLGAAMLRHEVRGGGDAENLMKLLRVRLTRSARAAAEKLGKCGGFVVTALDTDYPAAVANLLGDGAPPVLYGLGSMELLDKAGVGLVGTRRPSRWGRAAARSYGRALGETGRPVVSGNAPGVDALSHAAALEAGGATIVCPPTPLDKFVPSFSKPESVGQWLVLSPFPPGSTVAKWYFLRRNALVAALSGATVVVETGSKGGTLDTVGHLRRLRRPWFAVDYPPEAPRHGVHQALHSSGGLPLPAEAARAVVRRLLRAADLGAKAARASMAKADFFAEARP